MSKQNVLNDEIKFQRACSNFVQREVIYCVSSLIYELREVAERLDDYETYMTLTGGKPDYEEAALQFIMDAADISQLEEIAEEYGDWDEIKDAVGYGVYVSTCEENNDDPDDFEDWLKAQDECHDNKDSFTKAVRDEVWSLVNSQGGAYEWVCDNFNLEPEYGEIYEHWIVSEYLARLLQQHGDIVEEYMGLTVWGRPTTGQAILMDGVIREIVRELDDNHWIFNED